MSVHEQRAQVDAARDAGEGAAPGSRNGLTKQDLLATGAAVFMAVLVAVCLRGLGLGSTLTVGLAAYAAFVATFVLAELLKRHPQRGTAAVDDHELAFVGAPEPVTDEFDIDLTAPDVPGFADDCVCSSRRRNPPRIGRCGAAPSLAPMSATRCSPRSRRLRSHS